MKYAVAAFFALILLSCDNTLNVVEEYKDIPVVYGFISETDTAQYIRVERAFIDENTSALEISQIVDSVYYENANVSLFHVEGNTSYALERVNGNNEGYVREEGVFLSDPNYLYKINSNDINLVVNDTYRLVIERGDNLPSVEAETQLIGQPDLKFPNPQLGSVNIPFKVNTSTRFTWQGGESAGIYNLFLDFNYRERENGMGTFDKKTVTWKIVRNLKTEEDRVSVDIEGDNFFTFLRGAIEVKPSFERRIEDVTLRIQAGGSEIEEFIDISSANFGITSTQDPPFFSNIPDGRGVFSSMNELVVNDAALTNETIDSIVDGFLTSPLNFIN